MVSVLPSIGALLFGVALLVLGSGLQGTLLGIRGAIEGFSPTAIGAVMSAYYAGFAIGCVLAPRVIERVGHIRAFAAFASIASAAALVFPVFAEEISWLALRIVTGYCFAALYMTVESWLHGQVTNEGRGRLLAVYMIVNLGSIAAAQQLLNLSDPGGFVLFVLSSVLISLALVPIALTTSAAPAAVVTDRMTLGELYAISPLSVVGAFAIGLANGAVWGLVPLVGIRTGQSTAEIALFMSVIVIGGVIIQWPLGRLSDTVDRRIVIVGSSLVMAGVSAALFVSADFPHEAVLALGFVLGGVNLVIYPLCAAHINDRIEHEDLIQANAALLLVLGVGAAIGPLLGGVVVGRFGPYSLYAYMLAISLGLALFGLHRLRRRDAVPASEQVAFEPVVPAPASPVLDPRIDPEDIEAAS